MDTSCNSGIIAECGGKKYIISSEGEISCELPDVIKSKLGYPEIGRLCLPVKKVDTYMGIQTYRARIQSPPTSTVKAIKHKGFGSQDEITYVDTAIAKLTPTDDPMKGNIFGGNLEITDSRYTRETDFKPLSEEESNTHLWRGMSGEEWEETLKHRTVSSKGEYNLGDIQKGATYFSESARQALSYSAGFAPWTFMPTWTKPAVVIRIKRPTNVEMLTENKPEVGIKGTVPLSEIDKVYEVRLATEQPGDLEVLVDTRYKQVKTGSRSGQSQHRVVREVPQTEWETFLRRKDVGKCTPECSLKGWGE
jgi:hypothetical protein